MQKLILLPVACVLLSPLASAQTLITGSYNSGFENGGAIPDGSLVPWSDTQDVAGAAGYEITAVTVTVNITGGYNGDLYAYLSHGDVMVPLLNRPGAGTGSAFGYSDSGLNVTFTDGAANNIHTYQTVASYDINSGANWQPDGRTINPVTSTSASFDAAGTAHLADFNGLNPNGSWTLLIADTSGGGGQATLSSWGLSVSETTAVPEPATTGLMLAVPLLAFAIARRRARRL
jgi:subtilisin-like proprotein convertase family protein